MIVIHREHRLYLQNRSAGEGEGEREGEGEEGEENSQSWTREEIMLITAFGFFWFGMVLIQHYKTFLLNDNEAFRIALRALNQRGAHPSVTGEINLRHAMYPGVQRGPGLKQAKSYGCLADDAYCVVEEWEFF